MCFIVYFFVMIAFSIWSIDIYWYWIFYLISFALGYLFLYFVGKSGIFKKFKNLQNILTNKLDDLLIALILGVLIGGRLGEVFIYQWQYFSHHLLEIFAVWNGWMSFIGGMVWVLIAFLILKKMRKLSIQEFWILIDTIIVIVPMAIIFGRFGNYLNQELFGLVVAQDFWWLSQWIVGFLKDINIFHIYSQVDQNLRVNTNFLAMIFEWFAVLLLTISLFIRRIKKKLIKPALISWWFLVFYSVFRFLLEYLRIDSQTQYISIFTRSQWLFIVFFVFGIYFIFNTKYKKIII